MPPPGGNSSGAGGPQLESLTPHREEDGPQAGPRVDSDRTAHAGPTLRGPAPTGRRDGRQRRRRTTPPSPPGRPLDSSCVAARPCLGRAARATALSRIDSIHLLELKSPPLSVIRSTPRRPGITPTGTVPVRRPAGPGPPGPGHRDGRPRTTRTRRLGPCLGCRARSHPRSTRPRAQAGRAAKATCQSDNP
jgi:hypothetical protein